MGKVRPEHVKKTARELLNIHPGKFDTNFQHNKELVNNLAAVPSSKLRNRIAGYITTLMSTRSEEEIEDEEDEEEAEG
ncbi:MAG: 30S ribosomal protein S17e [Candidatus Bathyarchaeota archaeon]|nr:30S ribosomal protein S17e [Candidatus Bathyarchaeota archaeon]